MRLSIQDRTGHSTITEEEMTVEEMHAKFDDLVAHSYLAYTNTTLTEAEQVKSFAEATKSLEGKAPEAQEIFFTAPLVGG